MLPFFFFEQMSDVTSTEIFVRDVDSTMCVYIYSRNTFRGVLHDITVLARSLDSVSFIYIPRLANV